MYKIVCLYGEAGTGKDTILQELLNKNSNFHGIVSCTTRPPREKEEDGKNYFFYSIPKFLDYVDKDLMFEHVIFNGWYYGTSCDSVRKDAINIGVFNPEGIRILSKNKNCELLVFRITCSDKNRLIRQLLREENPNIAEIIRRYSADQDDFADLEFDYIPIENESVNDLSSGVEEILAQIERWIDQGQM